jgi:HEPN domain-containing protein
MSGVEHAREMIILAQRDFKALQGMLDAETFADEIFGFHAQQAVEMALKAWLSLIGVEYPRTHDLEELLELLEEQVEPILEAFYDLVDLTDFAVQFRYRIFEDAEGRLNRGAMIRQVSDLVVHVETLVREAEQAE